MTTDTLPATTTVTATKAVVIRNDRQSLDRTVTTEECRPLNHSDIHRDRRQDAYDITTIAAGIVGTGSAFAFAYSPWVLLNYATAGLTAALVIAAMILRWAVAADGRKWTYTTDATP